MPRPGSGTRRSSRSSWAAAPTPATSRTSRRCSGSATNSPCPPPPTAAAGSPGSSLCAAFPSSPPTCCGRSRSGPRSCCCAPRAPSSRPSRRGRHGPTPTSCVRTARPWSRTSPAPPAARPQAEPSRAVHLTGEPIAKGISIDLSSCGWCWGGWALMGFCFVARERPGYVDVSSGGGEGGLFVVLSFAVFPVVVGAGFGVVTGGRFGREVAGAQQSVVVVLGAVRVLADASGVFGDGCDACDGGEPVGGFEHSGGVAGEGDELRGKQGPKTGDAQQGFGGLVAMKPGLELRLDLFDFLSRSQRPSGEACHDHRGGVLSGNEGVLGVSGVDRGLCDLLWQSGVGLAQSLGDAAHARLAQLLRALVFGQQQDRGLALGVVERGFQAGEVLQQR